jgi:hypothetical protein
LRIAPVAETPKTSEQPPQPARQVVHCWLSLLLCCILAMLILPFLLIDISNNYHQGSRYLHELGLVMAVAAVAFAAVPMAAAFLGRWCWLTVGSTTVVGIVTVCAAYFAYTHAINVGIDSVVTMQAQNQTAREKRDAAQAELDAAQATLAGIAELMPSSALKRLYNNALERKAVESTPERGGCKPFIMVDGRRQDSLCRKAESEAAEYLRRMGDAEAKEKAESLAAAARKKLAEVETAADVAPPTQELAAIDLAQTIGTTPEEAARLIARGFAIGSIIMTVFMALLSHLATKLGMAAFGVLPLNKRKEAAAPAPSGLQVVPPPDKPAVATVLRLVAPSERPKRSRKPLTPEDRILQFVAAKLRPGEGKATGGAIGDALAAWWEENCKNVTLPNRNIISTVLTEKAHIERTRKGGCTWYATTIIE